LLGSSYGFSQNPIISSLSLGHVYAGIGNHIVVNFSDIPANKLFLTTDNGIVRHGFDYHYVWFAKNSNIKSHIYLHKITKRDTVLISTSEFKVHDIPIILKLPYGKNGVISIEHLKYLSQPEVKVNDTYHDFGSLNPLFHFEKFSLLIMRDNEVITLKNISDFSYMRRQIEGNFYYEIEKIKEILQKDDVLVFCNIHVRNVYANISNIKISPAEFIIGD